MAFFTFPEVVDDRAARTVATGVILSAGVYLATGWWPVLAAMALGFAARVASGPRFSPLALLATRVVVPRLPGHPRYTPGPPKRFAQGIGLAFSGTAFVLAATGANGAAAVVVVLLVGAASLEALFGFCVGCRIFALLMRAGVVPRSVCERCAW